MLRKNPGYCPADAKGKRIRGVLRDGTRFGFEPVTPTAPPGWPADGRDGCRWSLEEHRADIVEFEII